MFTVPGIIKFFFPSLLWSYPTDKKKVFLTFDDGPMQGITYWVLTQLKNHDAKATFFMVGENVERYPALVNSVMNDGHAIGNHTLNHINGWKVSNQEYIENIKKCDSALTKQEVRSRLFRPPYGRVNPFLIRRIQRNHRIVMWDLLSKDYSSKYAPEILLDKLIRFTHSGSIVVFHDSLKAEQNLRYILPQYLEFLTEKGYQMESIPTYHEVY